MIVFVAQKWLKNGVSRTGPMRMQGVASIVLVLVRGNLKGDFRR
jgi:hypothetical protein